MIKLSTKCCPRCRLVLPFSAFGPLITGSPLLRSHCKKCRSLADKARKSSSPRSFLSVTITSLRSKRVRQGVPFSLTLSQVLAILAAQDGRCAISYIPMTWQRSVDQDNDFNMSIDRINALGPYTKLNVQLICKVFNLMRGRRSLARFVVLCHHVASANPLD